MFDVCVLGLGYIGLPTAATLASSGMHVLGVDIDAAHVAALQSPGWSSPERGLSDLVQAVVGDGRLTLGTTPALAHTFIIAVPTPATETHQPDLRAVAHAGETVVDFLRPGSLVVLESTVAPGTTEQLLLPILQRSGLRLDEELFVAHAPERVLPGNLLHELVANDRIIGGIGAESAERARTVYRRFVHGAITCTDATTAETVKLMENTYRDVNIALANEFASITEVIGVNVWDAIALANRHPRVNILAPGPGVGGHCLAVDPYFLAAAAPNHARLILQARATNDGMADAVVAMIERQVQDISHPQIAVAGLAYKADVTDGRESPSQRIVKQLLDRSYDVRVSDPFVSDAGSLQPYLMPLEDAVRASHLLVVLTNHTVYGELDPATIAALMARPALLDTRHALDHTAWAASGFAVSVLGVPAPDRDELLPLIATR